MDKTQALARTFEQKWLETIAVKGLLHFSLADLGGNMAKRES
jgi:hypothetical protein